MPAAAKFVVVGAPHTSNWDFVVFLGALHHFRLRVTFLGKHTLFRWPLGILMRRLGGIPVRRHDPGTLADDVAAAFADVESMALVMAPEGTRSETAMWKSGFYRIALKAQVPVVPAVLDLPGRRAVIGPPIMLSGVARADMDQIREFYAEAFSDAQAVLESIRIGEERSDPGAV